VGVLIGMSAWKLSPGIRDKFFPMPVAG